MRGRAVQGGHGVGSEDLHFLRSITLPSAFYLMIELAPARAAGSHVRQ
jgi:hypothetical protein